MSYPAKRSHRLVACYKIFGVMLFNCLSTGGACLNLLLSAHNAGNTYTEVWLEYAVLFFENSLLIQFKLIINLYPKRTTFSGLFKTSLEESKIPQPYLSLTFLHGLLLFHNFILISLSKSDLPLGPVSKKPRKSFWPVKPFLGHLYLKTEKCTQLIKILNYEGNLCSF